MYSFDDLMSEVLRQKPNLTRDDVLSMIKEKKLSIGSGFLTDQGALFIIANELGVKLERPRYTELTLKDLQVGLRGVTIKAKILGFYPEKEFRRRDGSTGKYRKFLLFDDDLIVRAIYWGTFPVEADEKFIGRSVRLSNCSVRQGLDGKTEVILNEKSKLEVLGNQVNIEETYSSAKPKDIEVENITLLKCITQSEPKITSFEKDGTKRSVLQFRARLETGLDCRIVLWDPIKEFHVHIGSNLIVTNLKFRKGTAGPEFHGDTASFVFVLQKNNLFRVIKIRDDKKLIEIANKDREIFPVVISPNIVDTVKEKDIVCIKPDKEFSRYLVCESPGSVKLANGDIPPAEMLFTTVKEAKSRASRSALEVITLSETVIKEIKRKDGTVVRRAELLIGDDTDESKLVAWDKATTLLSDIGPGERLHVVGVRAIRTTGNEVILQIDNYSIVQRLHY